MPHPRRPPRRFPGPLLLVALLLTPAPAAARFDPAVSWRTFATAHFAVLFPAGEEELAGRAAAIAEEVHERLAPRVGWIPRERTRLILLDDADAAGGWATPYPYAQIAVQATPPGAEGGLGAVPGDAWLRLVITHEYAHALQMDMVTGGAPRLVNGVFGRLWFPNALQPLWLLEGLAVYEETELAAEGRGVLPAAQMVLRMAALEDAIPRLDAMAVLPDAWPAGRVPYLFGESFLRFLAERSGREALAAVSREHASRNLPFLIESTGRRVLGADYGELWREWAARLRERAHAEARALEARGLTASVAVTATGRTKLAPAWSPDGARLAWLAAGEEETPGVWVANADGSGSGRLVPAPFADGGLSWSRDGARLYYGRLELERGAALRSDVRAWDFAAGRDVAVTRGLRARDPDISPDGRALAAVTMAGGRSRLVLVPLDGPLPVRDAARLRALTPLSAIRYERPRWSPDGAAIAVALRRPDGTAAIAVLDRDGRTLAELDCGRSAAGPPAWGPDGDRVFFAWDRTGVFNVFAWEPRTGGLRQVTNVLGGAFSPAPSPDGRRLAFAAYSARGFDIHLLELDPAAWREAAPWLRDTRDVPSPPAPDPPASSPYSPLDTLRPRLWIPWLAASPASGTLAGLLTGGQDAAQLHRYTLGALAGPSSGRFSWFLDYAYEGLVPTLRFAASDADVLHAGLLSVGGGGVDYVERRRVALLEASFPVGSLEAPQRVTVGLRHVGLTSLSAVAGADPDTLPARGRLGSARIGWSLDATERPAAAISPERGRRVAVGLERFEDGLDSDRSATRATADWSEFLPLLPRHHVLQVRVFGGTSAGETPPQGAFRTGGDAPGEVSYALDDEALHLRGYLPNSARGKHALLGTVEYRFPLAAPGRGGVSAPFFLRRVHGAVFAEAGAAWSGDAASAHLRRSAGAEARLDLSVAYHLPVTLRAGLAYGFDEGGGVRPVAGIWISSPLGGGAAPPGPR